VVLIADIKEENKQHSEPQKSISAETTNSDQIELNEEPENTPIEENKEETKELDFEGTFYEFAGGPDESKYRNYHTYSNVCIFTSNTPMEHLIFIDDVKKTGKLTKQIIVAHLIDSISVKKGYELTVNFKINLEQFENGLEFQALSS